MALGNLRLGAFATVVGITVVGVVGARFVEPLLFGGAPLSGRAWVGWMCAVVPWAAAVACGLALRPDNVGAGWGDRAAVVVAGWSCGLVACAVLVSPWADVGPLFPVAVVADSWEPAGGALVDHIHGVRVEPDGIVVSLRAREDVAARLAGAGALQALVAVSTLALWSPLTVAVPGPAGPKIGAFVLALVALVLLYHAVAAARIGAEWLAVSGLPLVAASSYLSIRHARTSGHARSRGARA